MDPCALYKLPIDILHHVAAYLHETHRTSLYSFGLASKLCHQACNQLIFREVHLSVNSCDALQQNVDTLIKVLADRCSASHVRHLGLKGSLIVNIDGEFDELEDTTGSELSDANEYFWRTGISEVLGDEQPWLGGEFFPDDVVEVSPEEDGAWAPVVHLVKTLPHLTKLIYDCRNQFPPSLLVALHEHQPQCKLYHLTFRLRSLRSDTLDQHEMAIATSLSLHTIKCIHAWRDSNGEDDYHENAMPELVASLAPNLKELHMIELFPRYSCYRRRDIPREPWRGLPGFIPGRQKGQLTSLSLTGTSNFTPELLQTWRQTTVLSSLKHLVLGGGFYDYRNGINGEAMAWMVQNMSLPKLETLRIRLDRGERTILQPNYVSDAIDLFTNLESLYELAVDGPLEPEILDAILWRHGPTLRKLSLNPFESPRAANLLYIPRIPMTFEKMHILQIQVQCPGLQELGLTVKRTRSDAQEADMYRCFARFGYLQSLFLTLDCSNWQTSILGDDWDDFDREFIHANAYRTDRVLRKGHLRETFRNCAVDETLAQSIWKTICQHKAGKQLKSLKLYTSGGGVFDCDEGIPNDEDIVISNLSRFWLIEKSVRDDMDTINVKELGREAREARDAMESELYGIHYKGDRTGALLPPNSAVHIFRRIWPQKKGSMDWRQDWTSFPLHGC
ncbi:hypothetical protein GLAREA_07413 [Glarea lozoyensis ATCC 20868]|uniref:Uncharacterized protein n=1 Tax=Glarea lozoyensis (strain ATCC 20868 / MF5171) TaxID=1116229 RepID=S3D3F0_GLAL2|nr:uncharacterized protein GLAREA_07413 [Glarea lozoyensis ATCC 20868]EPE32280.1 hypothetical protein GLAREA_07413 [Glarea lozoyensis ATCC 20868]